MGNVLLLVASLAHNSVVMIAVDCLEVGRVIQVYVVAGRGNMDASHPVNLTHGSPAQPRFPSQVPSVYTVLLFMSLSVCLSVCALPSVLVVM